MSRTPRVLLALVAILGLNSVVLADQTLRVDTAVHLRAGGSERTRSLRILPAGSSVTLIGTPTDATGFYRVRTAEGDSGWVAGEFLIDPAPEAAGPGRVRASRAAPAHGGCSFERKIVKYLRDGEAAAIPLAATSRTIAQLRALKKPKPLPMDARGSDAERTVYRVSGKVTAWRLEDDGDIHLVLSSATNAARTIVLEVPNSSCTSGAPAKFRPKMTKARSDVVAALGQPVHGNGPQPINPPVSVTVTGIGFFDSRRHSAGHPPNCFELHPLLEFKRKN